jgi:hypothetical protein
MTFPGAMNIKVVASQVVTAYGINIANAGQLRAIEQISRATLDAAFEAADDFRAGCNHQYNLLLNFLRGLDEDGNVAAKLLALRQINLAFGCQATLLPNQTPLVRWTVFGAACGLVPAAHRPHLAAFFLSRNPGTALRDMETLFHTANLVGNGAQALEVMKVVMERNGDPSGISVITIVPLVQMLAVYRPMSGFMGFTQWGPGDHGDQASNLEAHVLKHVCRQPVDVNFGVSETIAWWDVLRVRLTLADYDQLAVNPMPMARACFEGALPLRGDRLKSFLICQALQNELALTQFVKNQALIRYRDFAIDSSRVMTNVIVHSNGIRVFISGCAGDAFIIGRLDGAQLGISSCYRPLDMAAKLAGARVNMCWPLRLA